MEHYVSRTLSYCNQKGELERIGDDEIASISEPVIVLGEPGMGKTELLKQIGKLPNMVFRSAAAFVAHPDPATLVQPAQRLIIDGLDELSAAQESDPVYRVLGQLIKAGWPPFILSCRAADWRGAVARQEIAEEYRTAPREVTLEPFSRESAVQSLSASLSSERAEQIVDLLEAKGVPDIYGNPLTLSLVGNIDVTGGALPTTRAALFDRACSIMWNEGNDRRANSPLAHLDKDAALTAAGAACAALVLTGSEAVSLKPSDEHEDDILYVSKLRALPGGENVRHLVGSRLFCRLSDADDHFRPIHRLIAEFLGARWLAAAAKNDQARERALALITSDGGVPASLRGIHAWLPHFDKQFAPEVIAADPYGLLRYGDADGLDVAQGRLLLQSLKRLQEANPFFRAEDWTRHSAKGLAHEELRGDIRDILLASNTTFHLRTLILEAIRGSAVVATLSDDLHTIMFNEGGRSFGFAEREDAAEAIISLGHGTTGWPAIVERLNQMGDEDSTRLALNIMDGVGYERFSAEQIAHTVLAHLGMLHERDAAQAERQVGDALFFVVRRLPDTQLVGVLDALAPRLPFLPADTVWHERSELADLVMRLIARQIEIAAPDPLKLLAWLCIAQGGLVSDESRRVTTFIQTNDGVRRTIQWRVLFVEHDHEKAWDRIWRMSEINRALMPSADDAICFLEKLAALPEPTSDEVEVWRELAAFARRHKESAEDILEAAHPFAVGKPELESYLAELSKPLPPTEWELKDAERRRQNENEKADAWAKARKNFSENEAALRSGELRWCFPVSQAYLGLFRDSNRSLPPPERIGEWLGAELQVAALVGLEAVLTRPDIPTLQQVADSYAKSQRWNFVHPLIAAVTERIRTNRGLSDLTRDVVATVRLALHHELLGDRIDSDAVAKHLDAELRREPVLYERYIRLLIEPSLETRQKHIPGLYAFVRTPEDRELASRLSTKWLTSHTDLPVGVESELLDVLADAGEFDALQRLACVRAERGFADVEHRRNWQAIGLLVDFDATTEALGDIHAGEKDFLWNIRHRLRGDHFQSRPMPTVTARQIAWIIHQFRRLWPYAEIPGSSWGDSNPWDATDFLQILIKRLASDPTEAGGGALDALCAEQKDKYTDFLKQAACQQGRARSEINFPGVTLEQLTAVIEDRPPQSTRDLLAIIRSALKRLQSELRGADTDPIKKYYCDNGHPRIEDDCTDRLIEDIQRLLPSVIGRVPQRDMPAGKRADVVFTVGEWVLPVECKGQWHRDLWTAACTQLDALYLRDWRSQDHGLYVVYWFGPNVPKNRRLKTPPAEAPTPTTPAELRALLIERLPPERRGSIAIEVLDLTR